MAEESVRNNDESVSLAQVVREIDETLRNTTDTEAFKAGLAALAGLEAGLQREKFILFSVGQARLAVSIESVAEIGDLPVVTRLPNLPSWLLGIINVRSEIISVMDLSLFLGWNVGETGRGRRMIILRGSDIKVSLRIDEVLGTYNRTEDTQTVAGNPLAAKESQQLLPEGLKVGDTTYFVIDCKALLANDRLVDVGT